MKIINNNIVLKKNPCIFMCNDSNFFQGKKEKYKEWKVLTNVSRGTSAKAKDKVLSNQAPRLQIQGTVNDSRKNEDTIFGHIGNIDRFLFL